MTEKRFTLELYEGTIRIKAIKDNGKIIYPPKVVELLNELHEENNELRLQLNLCSDQRNEFHRGARENANRVGKLEKEIQQLDKTIEELDNCQKGQSHRINDLFLENKQLKDLIIHLGYTVKYDGYRHITLELKE